MAYDTNVLRRASQRLEEDRRRREEERQVRQTDAYRRLPRLRGGGAKGKGQPRTWAGVRRQAVLP